MSDLPNLPDIEHGQECAPGTRSISVPRLTRLDRVGSEAIGPTVITDTIRLTKYRRGNEIVYAGYYELTDTWFYTFS